jgi:hypothetical protein
MAIKVRMVFLTLFVLGSCQAQKPDIEKPDTGKLEIEKYGWKPVFVAYNNGDAPTAKDSSFFGLPVWAFFAKDYPFEAGKESPKILVALLEYAEYGSSLTPAQRGITLMEFDCARRLGRHLRTFKADGSEIAPATSELQKWGDLPKEVPAGALLNYACRDRTKDK